MTQPPKLNWQPLIDAAAGLLTVLAALLAVWWPLVVILLMLWITS